MRILWGFLSLILVVSTIEARSVQLLTDQIGTSPKMIAAGNVEGIYDSPMSVLDNPALLSRENTQIAFMSTQLADEQSTFYEAAISIPFGPGSVGFGIMNLSSQNLDKTAVTNEDKYYSVSTFGTYDRIYALGYAQPINKNLSAGIDLKYFDQNLYTTQGTGFNVDLGGIWTESGKKYSLGFKNIFPNLKVRYSQDGSELNFPFQIVAGTRWEVSVFGVLGQLKYVPESSALLKSVGLDYIDSVGLSLHAGWKEILASNAVHNTYGCGVGLEWNKLAVQAGYELSDFVEQNARQYILVEMKI